MHERDTKHINAGSLKKYLSLWKLAITEKWRRSPKSGRGGGAVRHLVMDHFVGWSKNLSYLGDEASHAWNELRKCNCT